MPPFQLREPDLIARKAEAGWTVALTRSALPSLSVLGDQAEGVYEAYRAEVRASRNAMAHIHHLEAELARLRAAK